MRPLIYFGGLLLAALAGALAVYFLVKPAVPPAPAPPGPGNGAIVCPGDASCPDEFMSAQPSANMEVRGYAFPKSLLVGRDPVLMVCDGTTANGCPAGFVGYLANQKRFELTVQSCDGRAPCKANYAALVCQVDLTLPPKQQACPLIPGVYYEHP